MERFRLGHVAAQVLEAVYIRGVQLVTVQADPPPGREHRQKCCVFCKLLFVYYYVPYQIRTALKTTKEREPRSLQPRVRRCSNLPSYRIPQSFFNRVCSGLRRLVPSYLTFQVTPPYLIPRRRISQLLYRLLIKLYNQPQASLV